MTLRRATRARRGLGPGVVACALILAASGRAAGQETGLATGSEIEAVRTAESLRIAGDLAGAEALLAEVLARRPTSLAALIELEQVLRLANGLDRLVVPVERMLEADPTSSIGYQMLLRTYSALDRDADIERAARAWIEVAGATETPYREVARIWMERGDLVRAIRTLEDGRERLRRPDALALELGELHARVGDTSRALAEWSAAVGPDGRGLMLVRRRLAALPDGGASLIPGLVDRLATARGETGLRQAAAELAIAGGLETMAVRIAQQVASELRGQERRTFLNEMARRGDGARMLRLAHWAYSELVDEGGRGPAMVVIRGRLAELTLALGDTLRAWEQFAELERDAEAGSVERRQALAVRVQLTAREGRLDEAIEQVRTLRAEYADVPELDEATAAVARAALERGDVTSAEGLLVDVEGPRTDLVRAQLALRKGELSEARVAFARAARGLSGEEATRAIEMATLIGRISRSGGEVIGRATELLAQNAVDDAIALLVDGSASLPDRERAAILDFAADMADRSRLYVEADSIRRLIITEHATSPEAPGALLALARSLLGDTETEPEARELLERLILEYPRSALVPQARRELDRLRRAGRQN